MSRPDPAGAWRQAFLDRIQLREVAEPLKGAALDGRLDPWTKLVTEQVVRSCETLGWRAAAKGFPLDLLPKAGHEYLGLDAMAFAAGELGSATAGRWPFPVAVFELENSATDDRVAYSLWKVLCVRAPLRVVFAYRKTWEPAIRLVDSLAGDVLGRLSAGERAALEGQTLVAIGSRAEGEVFPWGYFKFWQLNPNVGRFEKL